MEFSMKSNYKLNGLTLSLILFILTPMLSQAQHSSSMRDIFIPYILLVFFSLFYNVNLKLESTHLFAVMLWISVFISTLIRDAAFDRSIISYLLFVLFFILITAQKWSKQSLNLTFKVYIISAVIFSLAIIGGVIFNIPYSFGRYSIDLLGIHKNPNYVAAFIAGAYSLQLYILLNYKNKKLFKKQYLIISIIIMILGTFFTGTRAAFLNIILSTMIQLTLSVFSKSKKKLMIISSVMILIVIIPLFINVFYEYMPTRTLERLVSFDSFEEDSRLVAWEIVLKKFTEYPILGLGLGNANQYLQRFDAISDLHNVLLELLVNQGLIGFSFYILMLVNKIRYINKKDKNLIITMGFTLFFPILFQNGLVGLTIWWPTTMFILFVNYSRLNSEGLEDMFLK